MNTDLGRKTGEIVAYRVDGALAIFDYTNEDEFDIGHVVMPDGRKARQAPLLSILAHGYWSDDLSAVMNPFTVRKHQSGKHDQKDHGKWATGSSDLPDGWTQQSQEVRIKELIQRIRSEGGHLHGQTDEYLTRVYERAFADTEEYAGLNGTRVLVAHDAQVSAADLKIQLDTVTDLQRIAPVENLRVEIDDKAFRYAQLDEGVGGFVVRGEKTIHLRARAVNDGLDKSAGNLMRVVEPKRYALVHEYGHVLDQRSDSDSSSDKANVLSRAQTGMSRYASGEEPLGAAGREAFAEAWTGWIGSQGRMAAPDKRGQQTFVGYFADKYGWNDGGAGGVPSAGFAKAERRMILADTFTDEGSVVRFISSDAQLSEGNVWSEVAKHQEVVGEAAVIRFLPGLRPVLKHQSGKHDQKTHGSWATLPGLETAGRPKKQTEYDAWGDRAREISFAENIGPSREELESLLNPSVDMDANELREIVSQNYAYEINALVTERLSRTLLMETEEEVEFTRQQYLDEAITEYVERWGSETQSEYAEMLRDEFFDESTMQEKFAEVFNVYHAGTNKDGVDVELQSDVERVYLDGNSVRVEGSVYDGEGQQVGPFERSFRLDPSGNLVVTHELLDLTRTGTSFYTGTGFGTVFNRAAENYYISHGIETIDVHAALSGGGYTWASAGFDWDYDRVGDSVANVHGRMKRYLESASHLPGDLRADIANVQDRLKNLAVSDRDFPTPKEISELGRVPDVVNWPGKDILSGANWYGTKVLAPEGPRVSDTQRAAAARREQHAAYEAARTEARRQYAAGRGQYTMDNDFLEGAFMTVNGMTIPLFPPVPGTVE